MMSRFNLGAYVRLHEEFQFEGNKEYIIINVQDGKYTLMGEGRTLPNMYHEHQLLRGTVLPTLPKDYFEAKFDKSKLRYDLIPEDVLTALAEVYTYGTKDYGENTWQDLPDAKKRYKGAFFRHWVKHHKSDKVDGESKLLHIKHALWNVAALVYLEMQDEEDGDKNTGHTDLY